MTIKKFMTPEPISIGLDASLERVKQLFEARSFHHLLVVEDDKLLGIISDRDYLKAISPNVDKKMATSKDLATLNKRAHQIMSHHPITVRQDDPLDTALKIFKSEPISCLPVLDSRDHIVGILTIHNLIDAIHVKHDL
ncbi:MAG: CBS domain-containing protein [Pseudomonadales bacterium]|nr:CBS domain-containing protein [Pseudomonadales bacterium]